MLAESRIWISRIGGVFVMLLAIFSLGLAVPFLLIAFGLESAEAHIKQFTKYLRPISTIGGVFLVILGVLLLFERMGLLSAYGSRFSASFITILCWTISKNRF